MQRQRDSLLAEVLNGGYNPSVETNRATEYPQLTSCTYLDHAATTLYAKSTIEAFSKDLYSNLYGNPHSPSPSSQLTTLKIDNVRLRVLQFFNADPEEFDVVFTANATAGIKLLVEGLSGCKGGFRYKYHRDAHTSLIGVRELAKEVQCLATDGEVEEWLDNGNCAQKEGLGLFGWPAQSNFTGRRLPRDWAGRLRRARPNFYSLLDAAALLTTTPLDLSDSSSAPDFTVFSFYKIFGFPDLGALIVRRASSDVLKNRRYFGGGTVDSLTATVTDFVARRNERPHTYLEDGTLPFHSIIALDAAMDVQKRLYGSQTAVSWHAFSLGKLTYDLLSGLTHGNGQKLCVLYNDGFESPISQGPIIAFNMKRSDGQWIGYAEVEKLLSVRKMHVRVGGMCNPGGVEAYVGLEPEGIKKNFAAGHKCSDENDVMDGMPTGAIRISFGAMSTLDDALTLVRFLEEFYIDKNMASIGAGAGNKGKPHPRVESLMIYPIKSCGGFRIPAGVEWEVWPEGLAWDREWCLVHLGTGVALSQKQYNKMVFIRPSIDLQSGTLNITLHNSTSPHNTLRIPLSSTTLKCTSSRVCGDRFTALTYDAPHIISFFSSALGVPCTLARVPATTTRTYRTTTTPIRLSNESPILIVSRASINTTGASPDLFRANIILSSSTAAPYEEDSWSHVQIGRELFELLGPCKRCHMICIDQNTAEKREEPYVTLAKTRRVAGRILFGQHAAHVTGASRHGGVPTVKVGDFVEVWRRVQVESEAVSVGEEMEYEKMGAAVDTTRVESEGVLGSIRSLASTNWGFGRLRRVSGKR